VYCWGGLPRCPLARICYLDVRSRIAHAREAIGQAGEPAQYFPIALAPHSSLLIPRRRNGSLRLAAAYASIQHIADSAERGCSRDCLKLLCCRRRHAPRTRGIWPNPIDCCWSEKHRPNHTKSIPPRALPRPEDFEAYDRVRRGRLHFADGREASSTPAKPREQHMWISVTTYSSAPP
jgi:hypothetical protein